MVVEALLVGSPQALDALLADLFAAAGVFVVGGDISDAGVEADGVVVAAGASQLGFEGGLVSGGREPPPPALLEPYVTVSRHTAPTVRRSSASVDLSAPPPKG